MPRTRPPAPSPAPIPGPTRLALLQALPHFARDPLATLHGLAERHGALVRLPLPGSESFLLNEPEAIERLFGAHHRHTRKPRGQERASLMFGRGLITTEGATHRALRRVAQPAFHRERVADYGAIIGAEAARCHAAWAARPPGSLVAMRGEMRRVALAVVGEALLGEPFSAEAAQIAQATQQASEAFPLLLLPGSEWWAGWPLPPLRRLRRARGTIDRLVYGLIHARRTAPPRDDLLGMLLAARDEAGQPAFDDEAVRDQLVTIFLSGYDTVASLLTWCWVMLAQAPQVAAQLHAELDTVLAGRAPTEADLPALPITRGVVSEALRLFPPVWSISRRLAAPFPVGDHRLPVGATVMASQWVTHRDPRWFPAPLQVEPSRWTAAAVEARPRYSFFPFGGGPRRCIGEPLAWLETTLVVAALAQQWAPTLPPDATVVPEPLITLGPRGPVPMFLVPRR